MKIVVTTSQSVLLVDCGTGGSTVLHRGAGLYYGIARIGNGYAVAARRRSVSSAVPRPDEAGCILLFDTAFRLERVLEAPFPLRDMHQIAWFDDRLWVTCSFDDMVATYDGAAWARWHPLELPGDGAPDRYHFNSFLVTDTEIALLAHNHGPSELHYFDRGSRAWLRSLPLGEQAHDVWTGEDVHFTCSSIESKLLATNGWERFTGGFPRGVCITPATCAVGISALSERGSRDWTSGAIALCNVDWHATHYVHLLREGMILDMLEVPSDEAAAIEATLEERVAFPIVPRVTDRELIGG